MTTIGRISLTAMVLAIGVAGCVGSEAAEAARTDATPAVPAAETYPLAELSLDRSEERAAVVLSVAQQGNQARYRVREQLVGFDLPNDAVGATNAVTGTLALDAQGRIVPAQSAIVVNVTGLRSDQERRDGFVQRRLLMTEEHPTVTLRPVSFSGVSFPLPTTGARRFELVGELTVMGVTRPTRWNVEARFDGERINGSASTAFTFADFQMTQPRVPVVLSVADTIRLEYDFNLTAAPQPGS